MTMSHTATVRERQFAEAFLKALGADAKNVYLVTAVVAWLRQESGQRYLGNNPLNIRNSPLAIGYRQTAHNGHFAIFKDLADAAKASAALLLSGWHGGQGDWRHYERIIAAVRRGNDGTVAGMQRQGLDFLTALAMSAWDSGHYGAPDGDPSKNHLIRVWSYITGLPAIPAETKPKKAPRAKPRPPRDLNTNLIPTHYIDPFEQKRLYTERHPAVPPLPGSLYE